MQQALEFAVSFFEESGVPALVLTLLGIISPIIVGCWRKFFKGALQRDNDLADIEAWLLEPDAGKLYTHSIGRVLDWVDRLLTPGNVEDTPNPKPAGPRWRNLDWLMVPLAPSRDRATAIGEAAWNWPLFDIALRVAVAYPIVLLVVVWALSGGALRLGNLEILRPDVDLWWRAATLVGLTLLYLSASFARRIDHRSRLRKAWFWCAVGLTLAVAVAFAVAVSAAAAAAVAVTASVAFAFAFAGAFAGVFAVAVAATVAVAGADAGAVAGAGAGAGAVAGAGAFALAAAWAVAAATRRDHGLHAYGALVAGLLGLLIAGVLLSEVENRGTRTALIFLCVMPLANGVFDFFSIGLTRWLVRRGARSGGWAWPLAIADIAAAGVLFTALGCTLILMIHGLGAVAGTPLFDLGALFDDLRHPERRQDYWWLYLTVFSTLLPTLLHLCIASFSMVAWIPRRLKVLAFNALAKMEQRTLAEWGAMGLLTGMAAFATLVPLYIIIAAGAVIAIHHPTVAGWYLDIFAGFAHWLGAISTAAPSP